MDYSQNLGLYLPSRDKDDIVDVNQISENFNILDNEIGNVEISLAPIKHVEQNSLNAESWSFQSAEMAAILKKITGFKSIKDQYGKEVVKEITGFVTILKQLTAQELTKRISTSVPDKDLEKYFAKNYSVKFDGIKSGDPVPTSYTQIYSNIASGYWSRVKVTSVEFNDYNKITKIRFNVYYN